ncbi:cation diffusion facilitator family transporter [Lachnospiraceae bacterium PF1-21]|uniref:cation diffusion facilitator family transporter n=1 Tax=Ohessyouella blattaphilus TaxID=2949333 RepID=UPI003E21F538
MRTELSTETCLKKVSLVDLAGNVFLTIIKFAAGTLSNSAALLSDAVHSASDVFSTLVMYVGVKVSTKEPNKKYPYGYGKLESVTAIIMSMILFSAGAGIGISGIQKIMAGNSDNLTTPGVFALIVALLSVAIKEGMFWYIYRFGKSVNSQAMLAEAWHQRTDALASIGSVVGILGARLGFPLLDPLAAIIIAVFILKTALSIFAEAVNKIIDRAIDDELKDQIKQIIISVEGVLAVHSVRGKYTADSIRVDAGFYINSEMTVAEAAEIKECVKYKLLEEIPNISYCMINAYPMKNSAANRKAALKKKLD